ncbi:MAG: RHS repeat-associated core domain-containing protein, partial [Myxococcales bacterium]|nr:RHS repeat-associated core domain-containing protein [Myxococcales bacterium]
RLTKLKTTRSSPVNTLQELSYWFDPSGNIVQVSDAAQQGLFYDDAFVAPDQKFVYDAIYRLVEGSGREHRSVGDVMVDHNDQPIRNLPLPTDPTAVRNYTETYSYDEVGNITQMFHDAVANTWTRDYSYLPANNRLTETSGGLSFRYDDHGSATEMPHLPTVTYSPFDQMVSAVKPGAGTVYFTYGSSGQRVRKVWEETAAIKHERIYLGAYEIFRKRVSGAIDTERQTLHVMDGAQRIAMVETKTISGGVAVTPLAPMYRYQLGNHLGSTMLEVDETGLVFSFEEYTPFGASAYQAARSSVDVSARRYRYAGKERDEETSLYYNGARYLAAWLGRWTSADPIGIGADGPGLYNYTRGSPVNYTDPTGTEVPWQPKPFGTARPAAKGNDEKLSEWLHIDKQIMRKTFDDAWREASAPETSTGASIGLYAAALVGVGVPTLLEEIGREVLNTPSEAVGQGEDWYAAVMTEDPDDALALGLQATRRLVGVVGNVGSLLPDSWLSSRASRAGAAEELPTGQRPADPSYNKGVPRSVGAAAATGEAKTGEALYNSLPEDVKYR